MFDIRLVLVLSLFCKLSYICLFVALQKLKHHHYPQSFVNTLYKSLIFSFLCKYFDNIINENERFDLKKVLDP